MTWCSGAIISDEELKSTYAHQQPYGEWLDKNVVELSELKVPNHKVETHPQELRDKLYKAFGYTYEDLKTAILPMARDGNEQTASMGIDIPIAVLSDKHQPLFNYFKQSFAQVTNPPIDAIREKVVTNTTVYAGSERQPPPGEGGESCMVLQINNPILTSVDMLKIKSLNRAGSRPPRSPCYIIKTHRSNGRWTGCSSRWTKLIRTAPISSSCRTAGWMKTT